eukprot:scaffold27255_cov55-Attheya_sp.AAC.3
MVKRQKEKQYQSAREFRTNSQLRSGSTHAGAGGAVRRLPFDCCALTLTPFKNPVCLREEGIIFENDAILPYLLEHKADPVTGRPVTSRDLKAFSDNTKIVAVCTGPNDAYVYSYEAVHELNIKPKHYEDLTTGQPFHRKKDLILLQDPADDAHTALRNINNFKHTATLRAQEQQTSRDDIRHSVTATRILEKIDKRKRDEANDEAQRKKKRDNDSKQQDENTVTKPKIFTDELMGSQMTSGKCSGSFTSTVMEITNENEAREVTDKELQQAQFAALRKLKKKGFVTLHTNMGKIGLEIHCDMAPRTATNFLGLAAMGAYDGTTFHRSIRNFMLQGGKPPSSKKETSLWGDPFVDEFDDRLTHAGSGIVSMANAGPGTNKRQFFITYKSAPHLDRKHSVFGRVVEGLEVLKVMETVPTDKKDRPRHEIQIERVEVLTNPIPEAEELERRRVQERAHQKQRDQEQRRASALGQTIKPKKDREVSASSGDLEPSNSEHETNNKDMDTGNNGIGKYLPQNALTKLDDLLITSTATSVDSKKRASAGKVAKASQKIAQLPKASRLKPPPKKSQFGNFSGW